MEPTPGQYDLGSPTSGFLGAISAAAGAGKRIRISFGAGAHSPAWLIDPAGAYRVPSWATIGGEGEHYVAPYAWSPVYIQRLVAFIAVVGRAVSGLGPAVTGAIDGVYVPGGLNYVEMITTGKSVGYQGAIAQVPAYTRAGYAAEWERALDATAASFRNMRVIMNVSQTWDEVTDKTGNLPDDWVATTVANYATQVYGSRVELQNASVPLTFGALIPYVTAKAHGGIPISAQIDWQHVADPSSEGGATRTPHEICSAYQFAYNFGARAIEINQAAFGDARLRPVIQSWQAALQGTGAAPNCALLPTS